MYELKMTETSSLYAYENNPRVITAGSVSKLASMIRKFGFRIPIIALSDGLVVDGHMRLLAARELNLDTVPVLCADDMSDAQLAGFRIAVNKASELADWDEDLLAVELQNLEELDVELEDIGFDDDELDDIVGGDVFNAPADVDDIPKTHEKIVKKGDVWQLGEHKLTCADSTNISDVKRLMDGENAALVFTDPPYGMGKEKDGVIGDNRNAANLLDFNKRWIPLSFDFLAANGSWYCWGLDTALMSIYSEILKRKIDDDEITFRNLITWDKSHGQGQNSELRRGYATADEKCLFVMCGTQGFNKNSDNFFEGYRSILNYLQNEVKKAGLGAKEVNAACGVSSMYSHWFSESQFVLIPEKYYNILREKYGIFNGEYSIISGEYVELKCRYSKIKDEYYKTRAYFDNTHDNFNNVWHFSRHTRDGSEGGHATPKPVELCERAVKSSCPKGGLVLDLFGGSGSTLIACETTGRRCNMVELSAEYCDVIIRRWEDLTGKEAVLKIG